MKTTTPALLTYLNALRPTSDAPLVSCNLYTISLSVGPYAGTVLAYTDWDVPVLWNSYTFLASSVLVTGVKYKATMGATVDQQEVTIMARTTDTIGGIPFLQAVQQGLLDGAFLKRERAFFSGPPGTTSPMIPIGTVVMFVGRFGAIKSVGRTTAQLTVQSDLTLANISMPRNLWQPNCLHLFCDSGCGLALGTYSATGTVGAGSTEQVINWSGSAAQYALGKIEFTGGANTGVQMTISSGTSSALTLVNNLPNMPATGDTFTAVKGCDHTLSTCTAVYSNQANFRGFPFVPPPQIITGPLSSTYNQGSK